VVGRTAAFVLLCVVMRRAFPLGPAKPWDRAAVRQLLSFGGWASISGVVSPMLDALDRFVIGAKLSASDVAMYAIPFSIADKLRILPRALARAAYPRLSSLPTHEASRLYKQLIEGSLNLMTPLVLIGIFASKHLMGLWIGVPQDSVSGVIAIVLLCGAWCNSLALIPFVYIQSRGRPNVTAVIHMLELLPFIALLFGLVHWMGVVGAALAWATRMMVDCVLLCIYARDDSRAILYRLLAHAALLVVCAYWMAHHFLSWVELGAVVCVLGVAFIALNYRTLGEIVKIKRGTA
jgi:O-antigen/teichoic acid export membrane protein